MSRQPTHATVVACWAPTERAWRAAKLSGPSGVGKSDLALRLLKAGWRLVGDDYVHLFVSGGRLFARAPDALEGRLEIRGYGIADVPPLRLARIVLAVELTHDCVDRLPEDAAQTCCGVVLPLLKVDPREPSACEKVAAALVRL